MGIKSGLGLHLQQCLKTWDLEPTCLGSIPRTPGVVLDKSFNPTNLSLLIEKMGTIILTGLLEGHREMTLPRAK